MGKRLRCRWSPRFQHRERFFTYISKAIYINVLFRYQSAARIARALFDIALHRNLAALAGKCLLVSQMFERRMWPYETLFKQFSDLPNPVIARLQDSNLPVEELREMDEKHIGNLIRNVKLGGKVKHYAEAFPLLEMESIVQPITRGVVRVKIFIKPLFKWVAKVHGTGAEVFWVWVEDPDNDTIYHSESCTVTKSLCMKHETMELVFTIPLVDPRPSQYLVRCSSDRWLRKLMRLLCFA